MERHIAASDFKARCLAILDNVARTGEGVVVTKHGKPVVRVVPLALEPPASTDNSATLVADEDELYFTAAHGVAWDAQRGVLVHAGEEPERRPTRRRR